MPQMQYQMAYRYEIVTPQGQAGAGEAAYITFPAVDGQFGILARHTPLVAAMGTGRMTVTAPTGDSRQYFISGGFVHVRQGMLTVLAEECVAEEGIDLESAFAEMERARRMPIETVEQRELRARALTTATVKFRIARQCEMRRAPAGAGQAVSRPADEQTNV